MRRSRLTAILATLPLVAVACGTATSPPSSDGPGGRTGGSAAPDPPRAFQTAAVDPPGALDGAWAEAFAAGLLARVNLPQGAKVSAHAPSKALEHPPEMAGLLHPPVVVDKFWTLDSPAPSVLGWLRSHAPAGMRSDGSGMSGSADSTAHFLAYRSASLPRSIALGDLYVTVVSTGPSTSAVAAHAAVLAQPDRPSAEMVPADDVSSLIGWALAPGGTPVRRVLTGQAAADLARDFNALRVSISPTSPCPLIPTRGGDIVVRFTADGHTWAVDVPVCPAITVTRDGTKLPALDFGTAFSNDLKKWVGALPQSGPPRVGEVIPLVQPPSAH